jgi:hypothetical protein
MMREIERFTGAQIKPMKMPTRADVAAKRIGVFKETVRKTIAEGELEMYVELVEQLVEEGPFDIAEIAAAAARIAERLARAGEGARKRETPRVLERPAARSRTGSHRQDDHAVRSMSVARDGIRPADVVGSIANEADVPGRDIGPIDIQDDVTYVGIPQRYVDIVLEKVGKARFRGRAVNLKVAAPGAATSAPRRPMGSGPATKRPFNRERTGSDPARTPYKRRGQVPDDRPANAAVTNRERVGSDPNRHRPATGSHLPEQGRVPNEHFLDHDFRGREISRRSNKTNAEILEAVRGDHRHPRAPLREPDDRWSPPTWRTRPRGRARVVGIDPESLDGIIVAHNFGDVRAGSRAPTSSRARRAREASSRSAIRAPAWDLVFGCPGWLQGVIVADSMIRAGDAKRVMVIGADTLSRISDPHDRDSLIYADGAGAVIVEARETERRDPRARRALRHARSLEHAVHGLVVQPRGVPRIAVPEDGRAQAVQVRAQHRRRRDEGSARRAPASTRAT